MTTDLRSSAARAAVLIALAAMALTIAVQPSVSAQERGKDCSRTSFGLVPINDLGTGSYLGYQGGLYPGGSNTVPDDHLAVGLARAAAIQPLDADGNPASNGQIGFMSIGVSNTRQEFTEFMVQARDNPAISPNVVLVNGAQKGAAIEDWMSPVDYTWVEAESRVAREGLTVEQVQAVWIKAVFRAQTWQFPDDMLGFRDQLAQLLRNLGDLFPNVQVAYLSSRIYGGYGLIGNNEPISYEQGFSVKLVIEDQIDGAADLNPDPQQGPVETPWIGWGPYLWADGMTPRSDGLIWECDDMQSDGIHPARDAERKVAAMLFDFLATSPTSASWFLADGTSPAAVTPSTRPDRTTRPRRPAATAPDRPASTTTTTAPVLTAAGASDEPSAPWPLLGGAAAALVVSGAVLRWRRVGSGRHRH